MVGTRAGRITPAMAFGHSFPSSTEEGNILSLLNVVNLSRHVQFSRMGFCELTNAPMDALPRLHER
jgi:hypothetical protein